MTARRRTTWSSASTALSQQLHGASLGLPLVLLQGGQQAGQHQLDPVRRQLGHDRLGAVVRRLPVSVPEEQVRCRISSTFSGPQCLEGELALTSSMEPPDRADGEGDLEPASWRGAVLVPLGERREARGAGSGGAVWTDTSPGSL